MSTSDLNAHIVLCNWSPKADSIIRELHAEIVENPRPIVVVTTHPETIPQDAGPEYRGVLVVPGDPSDPQVLSRAGIERAASAIILADPADGEHADSRSILIALAIEAIQPAVHTCVELQRYRNRGHFTHTQVDEVVCVEELTEKMLAQSTLTHGLTRFYLDLLSATSDTNEVYIVDVGPGTLGKIYRTIEREVAGHDEAAITLVGLVDREDRMTINPRPGSDAGDEAGRLHTMAEGEKLVALAYRKPDFEALFGPDR